MLEEGEVQTLTELGLTGRQARVFHELLKYETLTARALAIASKLARQDTYKVLDELQELGLVERQIDVPTKFAAIHIQDALSILLTRKIKQASDLEKKTNILINSFKSQKVRPVEDRSSKIFLVPGGETFILRLRKAVESTQKSIDIACSSKNLPQGIFCLVGELERATSRGVKIRCLTDSPECNDLHWKVFRGLIGNPSFEIRTLPNHSCARFCIYDKEELSIVLSMTKDFAKSPLLWSNCTGMLEAYQDLYEMMWHKSKKSVALICSSETRFHKKKFTHHGLSHEKMVRVC